MIIPIFRAKYIPFIMHYNQKGLSPFSFYDITKYCNRNLLKKYSTRIHSKTLIYRHTPTAYVDIKCTSSDNIKFINSKSDIRTSAQFHTGCANTMCLHYNFCIKDEHRIKIIEWIVDGVKL